MLGFCEVYFTYVWDAQLLDDLFPLLAYVLLLAGVLIWRRTLIPWGVLSLKGQRALVWGLIAFAVIGLVETVMYRVIPALCYPFIFGGP